MTEPQPDPESVSDAVIQPGQTQALEPQLLPDRPLTAADAEALVPKEIG